MAFCTKCGTKIEEGVLFCTNCGTKIDAGISAVQSGNQNTISPIQGIPNSTIETANKTVTCQGCLLNKSGKCTYYDCDVSEAERYDCGMRCVPELQKKQKNRNVIQYFIELGLYFLLGLLNFKVAEVLGINNWITLIFVIVIAFTIENLIKKNNMKKRRENAKRLS